MAALHEVSTDPAVLGVVPGRALAHGQPDGMQVYRRPAELYRAAGADEQVAADHLAWQKAQYRASTRQR